MIPLAEVRELARDAHGGQTDRQGRDYFTAHLEPIAARLEAYGELAVMGGLLHDILEDTTVTADDLRRRGVPHEVIAAVEAVSKREGESYDDLIARAAAHPLGRLVKLADNAHNLATNDELAETDAETAVRLKRKYERARETLLTAGRCPACGSDEIRIVAWGLVAPPEPMSDEERRQRERPYTVELGGCCVEPFDRRCGACGHTWTLDSLSDVVGRES